VDRLLSRLTPGQFREWVAYFELEPWGPTREDFRCGLLYALMYNLWTDSKAKRIGPEDVFPGLGGPAPPPRRRKTAQELVLAMQGITAALGGTFR